MSNLSFSIRNVLLGLSIAVLPMSASGAVTRDYAATAAKAARFFKYQEWANAAAMYEIMLEDSAKVVDTYAHAIAVAGMRNMPDYEMSLLERAQKNLIPMDSVFHGVQRVSFAMGHNSLYENFLLLVKQRQPWLTRSIEKQLLRYYMFRSNAPEIIRYSKIMLSGAPENAEYLGNLAMGYMLDGNDAEGIATYRRLLEYHPDNYKTLLVLGNYYDMKGDTLQALRYLRHADSIRATPYVTQLINRLSR
jgi:hypothetical protein